MLPTFNIKSKSFFFDLTIVLIDTFIGYLGTTWFLSALDRGSNTEGVYILFYFLVAVVLYLYAMLRFSKRLRSKNSVAVNDGDWVALFFNCMMLGAFIPTTMSGMWPELSTTFILIGFFVIAGGWYYLHYISFKNIDAEESFFEPAAEVVNPEKLKRKALLMMLPFSAASIIPVNVIVAYGHDAIVEYETLETQIIGLVMLTFLLAFLGWTFAYIPRRMTKAMGGISVKGSYFYWMLALSYFFRLFPF
jgi:hypothetical protein